MKPLQVWKKTYYYSWMTLVEISVIQPNGEGGSYMFDTISEKNKEKEIGNKFWKEVKQKAKTFEDAEIIYRKLKRHPSDLYTKEYWGFYYPLPVSKERYEAIKLQKPD